MKKLSLAMSLLLAPAALLAQGSGSMQASAHANANAKANVHVPASFSASGRTQLEATYARAREHHVPQQAIEHRVAEGQAKGASEAEILASSNKVEANMESAQEAMLKAGHKPSDAEVESGAYAMERGVTSAQINAMASHAASGRSLDVAFNVLTKLSDQGIATANAVAEVQSKLDAHASDASITSLVAKGKGGVKIGGGL
jgi:hypothetical protein